MKFAGVLLFNTKLCTKKSKCMQLRCLRFQILIFEFPKLSDNSILTVLQICIHKITEEMLQTIFIPLNSCKNINIKIIKSTIAMNNSIAFWTNSIKFAIQLAPKGIQFIKAPIWIECHTYNYAIPARLKTLLLLYRVHVHVRTTKA